MRLGVLIAVDAEAAAIRDDEFFHWKPDSRGSLRSEIYPLSFMQTGVGKVYAARAAAILAGDCDLLCTLGTAAGLSDEKIGQLFLCGDFFEHDMDASPLGFAPGVTPFDIRTEAIMHTLGDNARSLVHLALSTAGLSAEDASLASGDQFLAGRSKAHAVRRAFGAQLLDMESAAVAKIALLEKRQAFALRWVSDSADRSSPTDWATHVRRSAEVFRVLLRTLAPMLQQAKL
ncbi:MAG: hypothetical protein E4H20_05825 [Spirochaetales bacterium]|nr:MAG: hypothetical protein E4H20_05825 [Spirochaetales bacterium]